MSITRIGSLKGKIVSTDRTISPEDLTLHFPMQVLFPYKRISSEVTIKDAQLYKPDFEKENLDVELKAILPSGVYGVYPRIFLLWLARQYADRQYLPSAIAREIPLIPFDLFTASLDIINGVSSQARQDGLIEFLESFPDFRFRISANPQKGSRKGYGSMGSNINLVTRQRFGLVALKRDFSFHPDGIDEDGQECPEDLGPGDTVLERPAFVRISEKLQHHMEEFQRVPDLQVVRAIAHSPLALDIYADMIFRGLGTTEWQESLVHTDALWLDWPGKDVSEPEQILWALALIKGSYPSH